MYRLCFVNVIFFDICQKILSQQIINLLLCSFLIAKNTLIATNTYLVNYKKSCNFDYTNRYIMFTEILNNYLELEEHIKDEINRKTDEIFFSKHELILKQGNVSRCLYYLETGLVRAYCIKDNKEITNWFSNEGTLVTSAYSFIGEKPGFESIVAMEDCKMLALSRKDLYALYDKYPALNEMGRKLIEIYFLELEERINAIHFQSAKQRYATFVKNESYLLNRVSLGHIASYLGITQETLSRIRNKI